MLPSALFEQAFNSSPIGNYLLSPTPEAIILAVNDAFLKASSRRREELVGVSLFVAFPENPGDGGDTGERALRDSLARVIATGQPDTLPAQRYPIWVEQANGEMVYEERFWSATSTPVFDDAGRLACISHTTRDITEQVRSQTALRESEGQFRALTTATSDVIYRMSPDWSQLWELDGRGFLQDKRDTGGLWLDDYVPLDEQPRVHAAIADAIRTRTMFQLEHRVRRVDGTEGWTLSRAVPMLDARGEVYEWIGTASDITERKVSEEKLRESDRRKDEFLAMLAHELRNPLAPVGAAAALLQRGHLDDATVQRTSRIIGRQVGHMTALIDDLLDVSRVTRGLVKLERMPLDLMQVVLDAIEQVAPLLTARRHELEVSLPPEHTMVQGDQKRLVQVLSNLLNNAAKYTPDGGRLEVRAELTPGSVCLRVTDNGIGMAPELVERAFDLFAQAERSSDRASGGLGLGLALVKNLVELHGGSVRCESGGTGRGSTFEVCLPHLKQPGADTGKAAPAPAARSDGHLRILVVDDNVDAGEMLAALLEASGHEVLVEQDSYRALELAIDARPDICLLDIGLPGMSGNELARQLRGRPETAAALLVAVTGYGQESDRRATMAAGFDDHLVKPIDYGRLLSILSSRRHAPIAH